LQIIATVENLENVLSSEFELNFVTVIARPNAATLLCLGKAVVLTKSILVNCEPPVLGLGWVWLRRDVRRHATIELHADDVELSAELVGHD
jgi:hypothetical protein